MITVTSDAPQLVRQGDVLLLPIQPGAIAVADRSRVQRVAPARGRLTLAQGETSLHEHTVAEDDAELIRIGERMLLTVLRPTALRVTDTVTGDELPRHTSIALPGGLYEVRIQRELLPQPLGMPLRWRGVRD